MLQQFHVRGLTVSKESRRRLEQSLERLQGLVSISATAVVLEHQRNGAPAFRAFVSLAVPGPDIHAEAFDHTFEAAWLKVIAALRRKIEYRNARKDARVKRNGHLRRAAFCRTRTPAGSRG